MLQLSSRRRSNTTNAALQISSIFHRFDLLWLLLFRFLPFWWKCSSEIGHRPPVAASKFVCKPILIALYHRRWGSIRSSKILNNFHWAICNVWHTYSEILPDIKRICGRLPLERGIVLNISYHSHFKIVSGSGITTFYFNVHLPSIMATSIQKSGSSLLREGQVNSNYDESRERRRLHYSNFIHGTWLCGSKAKYNFISWS